MNKVTLEMQALPSNQMFARAVVAAYMTEMDPTAGELTEVKTAVSEAVSNAVIHGYSRTGKGVIKLEIDAPLQDTLVIKVIDFGKGIKDVEQAREPLYTTAANDELSGMGFTVMESFMDKVTVESGVGEGTVITLIKKLDSFVGL